MNIELEVLSATSVRVSWELLDIPEITGYIVYYSQTGNSGNDTTVNFPSSTSSVVITDLTSSTEYQFEVVAVAELDGEVVMGKREEESKERVTPTSSPTQPSIGPIIGGVVAILIAVIVAIIILVILFCLR